MEPSRPGFIVGIGGSAGGLGAYKALLGSLSVDTGMAFVVVSHMMPTASSELAQILSWHTEMPVIVASDGMRVRGNQVYVSSPNSDLLIEKDTLKVVIPRTSRNTEIDRFLISLAEAGGARAIGVIFSGYDGDGTEGCRRIKKEGGMTFAQDESAEVNSMPLSAQASGSIDFVLPPARIAKELQKIASAARRAKRDAPGP